MTTTNGDENENSLELVEPKGSREDKEKNKRKKKAKSIESLVMEKKVEDHNAVSQFKISEPLREKLKEKGIESLFPIQAMTFDTILHGFDLVGRARTGQGKTLAFVLPIIESITNGPAKASRKTGDGRPPSVLVLLPTRELACQVNADFEVYGAAMGLTSCCLYGGASYQAQEIKLKKGVDIVIGTPGRVKDHIERGKIDLSQLKFRVLDEADEMLRMGFFEDVELILGKVKNVGKVQTLLFSATLPDWVKHIAKKFLKPDKETADLVGDTKMKASTSVRHIILPCTGSARSQLIPDIILFYSSGGRTIIFTETKESASQLAELLPGAKALHGDIQQAQREVTLSGFRSGKFMTLVATNVAARGLDINDVQLIIQCEPPRDVEAYIHRSGRTGRAGNTGVSVMLYDPRRSNISKIERESGVKFEHVSAPQANDIAKAIGAEAAEMITQVSDSVIPAFKSAAEDLLNNSGLSVVDLLAKALAKAVGYTEIKKRSLLTSMENYVTLLLDTGRPIFTPTFAYKMLRRFLPEEKVEAVKSLTITADGNGVVFDVLAEDLDTYLAGKKNASDISLEVLNALPRLQQRDQSRGGRFGDGNGRGGRIGGGGRNGRFSSDRFANGGGRGRGNWGGKTKLEENPRKARQVLIIFHRMECRRENLPIDHLDLYSKKYVDLKMELSRTERHILKEMGFICHVEHPHKFISNYLATLETPPELRQEAWNLANDSLRTTLCVRFKSEVVACGVVYAAARRFQVPLPENPPWWKAFDAEKSGIDEVCRVLAHLYSLPKAQYLPICKDWDSFTFSNKSLESKSHSTAKDAPRSSSPINPETALKGAPGEANIDSSGSKGALVKQASDKLNDARKSDDESKSIAAERDVKDEPTLRSRPDRKMETSGELHRDRERDRIKSRDRERGRDSDRERERGRDSDREREREEAERVKLKDHGHRSRERAKDSGHSEKSKRYSSHDRDRDYYSSSYPSREKDRHRHH